MERPDLVFGLTAIGKLYVGKVVGGPSARFLAIPNWEDYELGLSSKLR